MIATVNQEEQLESKPPAGKIQELYDAVSGCYPENDADRAIRMAVAVDLFVQRRLPSAHAARLAGVPLPDFLATLQKRLSGPEGHTANGESPVHPGAAIKLSVLMPVFNEKKTILEIIRRVRDVDIPKEIIVVDDASTDGTRDILRDAVEGKFRDVRVLYQDKNRGKGAAIRRAIETMSGDYAIIQDADLEYDPQEYGRILDPILRGDADVVFGSRFLGGGAHRVLLFWHSVGNKALTLLSNMVNDLTLTDMETCYKAFRSDVLKGLTLRANRFEIEPEITAQLARRRSRIYEVSISYRGRDYSEGKKIGWKDGVQAIWWILRCRWSR